MNKYGYRFSFGPWNIHEGADPFGPPVRESVPFAVKLAALKDLGYDAMHSTTTAPCRASMTSPGRSGGWYTSPGAGGQRAGRGVRRPAPVGHPNTIDGGFTANDPALRNYAIERSKKAADIAREMGTNLMVLWLAAGLHARPKTGRGDAPASRRHRRCSLTTVNCIAISQAQQPMDVSYIDHRALASRCNVGAARVGCLVSPRTPSSPGWTPPMRWPSRWPDKLQRPSQRSNG